MSNELDIQDEEHAAQEVIATIGIAPKAIKSEDDYNDSMKWLANVGSKRKKIEKFWDVLDKPLKDSMRTIKEGLATSKERMEKILQPLVAEERKLRQLTADYFMKRRAEADKKQNEINEKNRIAREAAVAAGKPAESVAPPKVVNQLQTSVKNDNGGPTATMRMVKNWRVVGAPQYCQAYEQKIYRNDHPELVLLPDQCWVLDTARANAVAKSGMSPALELFDVPSQAISG